MAFRGIGPAVDIKKNDIGIVPGDPLEITQEHGIFYFIGKEFDRFFGSHPVVPP